MKRLSTLVLLLGLTACASTHVSGGQPGPDGMPIYAIAARKADAVFAMANQKCPRGYDFIAQPQVDARGRYRATIECR